MREIEHWGLGTNCLWEVWIFKGVQVEPSTEAGADICATREWKFVEIQKNCSSNNEQIPCKSWVTGKWSRVSPVQRCQKWKSFSRSAKVCASSSRFCGIRELWHTRSDPDPAIQTLTNRSKAKLTASVFITYRKTLLLYIVKHTVEPMIYNWAALFKIKIITCWTVAKFLNLIGQRFLQFCKSRVYISVSILLRYLFYAN